MPQSFYLSNFRPTKQLSHSISHTACEQRTQDSTRLESHALLDTITCYLSGRNSKVKNNHNRNLTTLLNCPSIPWKYKIIKNQNTIPLLQYCSCVFALEIIMCLMGYYKQSIFINLYYLLVNTFIWKGGISKFKIYTTNIKNNKPLKMVTPDKHQS